MTVTDITYKVPAWLKEYCSRDFNTFHDWMTRLVLFQGKSSWVVATDGIGCVALMLPIVLNSNNIDEYLLMPNSATTGVLNDLIDFDKQNYPILDILRLKAELTALTRTCMLCNNAKKLDCDKCETSTEVTCGDCNGRGSFPCPTCRKPDQCKTCEGLGVVECKYCEGGRKDCDCCENEVDYLAELSLDGNSGKFNLTRLKKILVRFNSKFQVKINDNRITVWDETQLAVLMGLNTKDSYKAINLDIFKCSAF